MSELRKPYIKLWAAETLLSDDMASLSDHDERVFWRLMMVASLEEERWITRETPGLHRKCISTAQKFTRAIANLEELGMVKRLDDGRLFVVNGKKWNEDTDRTRYPSDSPERVKERVGRFRNGKRNEDVTSGNDSLQNDVTTPYRKEKEKEKEKESARERACEDDGRDDLPLDAREIRDLVISKLPPRYQRDPLTWEEAEQLGQDYAGQHTEVCVAIEECRRTPEKAGGGMPFPQRLRRFLAPPAATVQRFEERGLFSPTGEYVGRPVWEDEADAAAQSTAPQVAS